MNCPECGNKMTVTKTSQCGVEIERVRHCAKCNVNYITHEAITRQRGKPGRPKTDTVEPELPTEGSLLALML